MWLREDLWGFGHFFNENMRRILFLVEKMLKKQKSIKVFHSIKRFFHRGALNSFFDFPMFLMFLKALVCWCDDTYAICANLSIEGLEKNTHVLKNLFHIQFPSGMIGKCIVVWDTEVYITDWIQDWSRIRETTIFTG